VTNDSCKEFDDSDRTFMKAKTIQQCTSNSKTTYA